VTADLRPARVSSYTFYRSLLGSLAVAPVFLLCAWLYHQTTDFVYGPMSYDENAGLVRTIRWLVFGGLSFVLLSVIVWLKIWHPRYGNNPYSLLILLPVIGFVAFSNWIFGILVFGLLITVLVFTQLFAVLVRDELRRPAGDWGAAADRAAILRLIILFAMLALGVWLMITSRSWAYRTRQLEEIQLKNLYSEPATLQQLADGDHKEYVLVSIPGVRVDHSVQRKFGSGDDSYTLEYGVLTDRTLDKQTILDWKLWVYMPAFYKGKEFPMIFQAVRCTVGKDCHANFIKLHDAIIRRHFPDAAYRDEKSGQIAKNGQTLVELTPEPDLVIGDAVWREKVTWRAHLLLLLQALYSLVHLVELLLIQARLKAAYPTT
jgi:hypothetical protein